MSVIYKVITRPTDPRVPNSPKRYYPHLITLGQSVNLKYIAQKMQDRSSLSVGDIKSVIQNFVEKMKEQLLDVLDTLTPREEKVLRLRFGLDDGHQRTLEEVGREFKVTRERIRQIEAKALRKLRHPSRSKKLKDYLD